MLPNPQETPDLVTLTQEVNFIFLCNMLIFQNGSDKESPKQIPKSVVLFQYVFQYEI